MFYLFKTLTSLEDPKITILRFIQFGNLRTNYFTFLYNSIKNNNDRHGHYLNKFYILGYLDSWCFTIDLYSVRNISFDIKEKVSAITPRFLLARRAFLFTCSCNLVWGQSGLQYLFLQSLQLWC